MLQETFDEKRKIARLALARVGVMLDRIEWRAGKEKILGGVEALEEATMSLVLAADCIKDVVPE
jgi:hypothetical protein